MPSGKPQPVRLHFDNLLLETVLTFDIRTCPHEETVRRFAAAHGIADSHKMPVTLIGQPSGLMGIACPGYRIPVSEVYANPHCLILDAIGEETVRELLLLSAAKADEEEPEAADLDQGPTSEIPPKAPSAQAPTAPSAATPPPAPAARDLGAAAAQPLPLSLALDTGQSSPSDFTLDLWVWIADDNGPKPVAARQFTCGIADQRPFFAIGQRVLQNAQPLAKQTWHHLCWRYSADDDELLALVDGQPAALASPWTQQPAAAPSGTCAIGHWDQLTLLRGLRNGQEIRGRGKTPPTAPPAATASTTAPATAPPAAPAPNPPTASAGPSPPATPAAIPPPTSAMPAAAPASSTPPPPIATPLSTTSTPVPSSSPAALAAEPQAKPQAIAFLPPDLLIIQVPARPWPATCTTTGTLSGQAFSLSGGGDRLQLQGQPTASLQTAFSGNPIAVQLRLESLSLQDLPEGPQLQAELTLLWPADILNRNLPWAGLRFLPTWRFQLEVDPSGQARFRPRALPLALDLPGCQLTQTETPEPRLQCDLGAAGSYSLTLPWIAYQPGHWRIEGSLELNRAPTLPTALLQTALQRLGLAAVAQALPAALAGNANSADPTRCDYRFAWVEGVGFDLDLRLPTNQPLTRSATKDETAVTARLAGLGCGALGDQWHLSLSGELELGPTSGSPSAVVASERLTFFFTGNPQLGYLPLPLFADHLTLHYQGQDRLEFGLEAAFPRPKLIAAAPLVKALAAFLDGTQTQLDPELLAQVAPILALDALYLQAPAPGSSFGERQTRLSLESDQLSQLLEALRAGKLPPCLDVLARPAQAAAAALALVLTNATTPWSNLSDSAALAALASPTALATAKLVLPLPLESLSQLLFGTAAPAPLAPATPPASSPVTATGPLAQPSATAAPAEIEVPDEAFAADW